MKTLSTDDLSIVTGGKNLSNGTSSGGSGGGGGDDQLLTALQGIQSSLKDLGKNQNQGLFGGQNGMLFMTMALALSSRRNSEVVVCGGNGCRSGFSWRTW